MEKTDPFDTASRPKNHVAEILAEAAAEMNRVLDQQRLGALGFGAYDQRQKTAAEGGVAPGVNCGLALEPGSICAPTPVHSGAGGAGSPAMNDRIVAGICQTDDNIWSPVNSKHSCNNNLRLE